MSKSDTDCDSDSYGNSDWNTIAFTIGLVSGCTHSIDESGHNGAQLGIVQQRYWAHRQQLLESV